MRSAALLPSKCSSAGDPRIHSSAGLLPGHSVAQEMQLSRSANLQITALQSHRPTNLFLFVGPHRAAALHTHRPAVPQPCRATDQLVWRATGLLPQGSTAQHTWQLPQLSKAADQRTRWLAPASRHPTLAAPACPVVHCSCCASFPPHPSPNLTTDEWWKG